MNIAKNMEVIFFGAIALISATTFANASSPVVPAKATAAVVQAAPQAPMQVVTVSAKRMSAAEKAATAQ